MVEEISLTKNWKERKRNKQKEEQIGLVGWLVVLGLTALWDNISVSIRPSPKEGEGRERTDES